MAYENKVALAKTMAELTGNLGIKLETIAVRVTGLMGAMNASMEASNAGTQESKDAFGAHDRMDGILYTLSILGIPCEAQLNDKKNRYIAVEIAGETFYVDGGAAEPEEVRRDG